MGARAAEALGISGRNMVRLMTLSSRLLRDPFETARMFARLNNLVCDDGTVVCWACEKHWALLPSLHCAACLQEAWHRLNIHSPCCEQREQTEEDRALMARQGETK